MKVRVAAAACVLLTGVAGCSSAEPPEPADTEWGNATAVEELVIGVETGPDEYMLSSVAGLAVAADGTMYVVQRQPPFVRVYDADGTFVRDIGAQGQGPGEFSERGPSTARLLDHGALAVWDLWNTRVSIFSNDGEFLHSFTASGLGCQRCMERDVDGNLYIRNFNRAGESEADVLLEKYTPEGERLGEVTFPLAERETRGFGMSAEGVSSPQFGTMSTWSPLGYVVTGRNDTYEIELRKPEGVVTLHRDIDPARLHPEEHEEWEVFRQLVIGMSRERGGDPQYDPDPIPEVKPFFRDIFAGEDGRIWVFRYVAAEKRDDVEPLPDRPDRPLLTWREPWTFDVFEHDGTFLGSVEVPELFEPFVFRDQRIWGMLEDADGVERIVRLRVVS